jgi:hypothetical protein
LTAQGPPVRLLRAWNTTLKDPRPMTPTVAKAASKPAMGSRRSGVRRPSDADEEAAEPVETPLPSARAEPVETPGAGEEGTWANADRTGLDAGERMGWALLLVEAAGSAACCRGGAGAGARARATVVFRRSGLLSRVFLPRPRSALEAEDSSDRAASSLADTSSSTSLSESLSESLSPPAPKSRDPPTNDPILALPRRVAAGRALIAVCAGWGTVTCWVRRCARFGTRAEKTPAGGASPGDADSLRPGRDVPGASS